MNNNDFCEISNIKFNDFYDLIQEMTSDIEVEILKAQGINNVLALLRAKDLDSIFQIDCEELDDLKKRACLKLKSGKYIIRPAIKENLDYCVNVLKNKSPEQQLQPQSRLEQNKQNLDIKQDSFMDTFINNLNENMHRSKHRYIYNTHVRRFASSVYGLGGRDLYEFLRLNLPGAFPSIPTLESYSNEYCTRIEEGEFRFKELVNYSNKINCSFVYSSEDSTSVISKVQYDIESNSFIGFCVKLVNGLPLTRQYQTDNFTELENWFETANQATLVNINTVQLITNVTSPSFLLSGFGTDNSYDTISIICRWLYVYEQCQTHNIRVVGFASDADSKYLRAMRLATGYFAQLPNINLLNRDDIFNIQIPKSWSSWFFLRSKQLFSASLFIGSYRIAAKDLQDLIQGESKLDHGLVLSDLYVKDKQNYSSCVKISSLNVLNMLEKNKKTLGTQCYLTILHFVTLAYIDKSKNVLERLFYSWSIVFISRFWWIWLKYKLSTQTQQPSSRKIEQHFMTYSSFYSIELNPHVFTYIFSTIKISILNEIKSTEEFSNDSNKIKFPKHHKQNKNNSLPLTLKNLDNITLNEIEKSIKDAFEYAKCFIEKLDMLSLLKKNNVFELNTLCARIKDDLNNMIFVTDDSELNSDDDDNDDLNVEQTSDLVDNHVDSEEECIDAENACTTSKKDNYNGIRIYSAVSDQDKNKFFKININGIDKFIHKQTAAWYLTKKDNHLSSDRRVRVQQTNKQ
ncbi:unnamed protein product [Rotaria sordida]|uniref:Uncharacterized protein n=1 Tax=Rotaria sordida TaxID=392033 RepID=A0A818RWZ5_9BILA|nr:unnamed protein product [Rotaria sordida]CAF3663520.1 unnamed protein product [Rotaria sordida]